MNLLCSVLAICSVQLTELLTTESRGRRRVPNTVALLTRSTACSLDCLRPSSSSSASVEPAETHSTSKVWREEGGMTQTVVSLSPSLLSDSLRKEEGTGLQAYLSAGIKQVEVFTQLQQSSLCTLRREKQHNTSHTSLLSLPLSLPCTSSRSLSSCKASTILRRVTPSNMAAQ